MNEVDRPFRVVTHKNWLAAQFAPMGAVQDFGFDIDPATAKTTLWWAPGAWVVSALETGMRLPLLSCGPHWLDRLPHRFTGRTVHTIPFNDVPATLRHCWPDQVFAKLPEAKVDTFPAQLHDSQCLADTLTQYQLPPYVGATADSRAVQDRGPVLARSRRGHSPVVLSCARRG